MVLLIGIPLGSLMLLKPEVMWWTFESRKFKNPEANEPSEISNGFRAMGGAFLIVASLAVALMVWPFDRDTPPQDRGAIPIVGYQVHGNTDPRFEGKTYLDVSYLVPDGANVVAGGMNSQPHGGCEIMPTVNGLGTGRVTVDLHMYLSEPSGYYQPADDQKCHQNGNWSPYVSTMRVTEIRPDAIILTNGSIVDQHGTVLVPAAVDNRVPHLDATL